MPPENLSLEEIVPREISEKLSPKYFQKKGTLPRKLVVERDICGKDRSPKDCPVGSGFEVQNIEVAKVCGVEIESARRKER